MDMGQKRPYEPSEGGGGGGAAPAPLLEIEELSVRFELPSETVQAVNGISLEAAPGETFALVGESGSGKSVSMLSVMGLLPSPPAAVSGSIRLEGREVLGLPGRELKRLRGRTAAMVFQEPMSSLNPVHRVGRQIGESLRIHCGAGRSEARKRAVGLLDRVGIPGAASRVDDYPHEFSGGMRQRAVIAMALAASPKLLIADEPTTALDVTVQAQIIDLVRELQEEYRLTVVWITHDLGVVAEIADRAAVMYAGRILETGPAAQIYGAARHPYTSGLLRSIPRLDRPVSSRLAEIPGAPLRVSQELPGCPFLPRCPLAEDGCAAALPELEETGAPAHRSACIHQGRMGPGAALWPAGSEEGRRPAPGGGEAVVSVRGLAVEYPAAGRGPRRRSVRAVDGVDLELEQGRTLGLVGESGCGKTTLGRALAALVRPAAGSIEIDGRPIDYRRGRPRAVQMIFQDPFSAMNPGMKAGDIIAEPLRIHRSAPARRIQERVERLLEQVGLPPAAGARHPHEFSGGQRQRIAVARALAARPKAVVCDEPVSSLDASVQAQVVNLLADLQDRRGLALLFIAHDLAVVRHISHEVAVMYMGKIVERAPRDRLYEAPRHPYTKALLAAAPAAWPGAGRRRIRLAGGPPSLADPPPGCRFHPRCPEAVEGLCGALEPEPVETAPGHWVSCHLVSRPSRPGGPPRVDMNQG